MFSSFQRVFNKKFSFYSSRYFTYKINTSKLFSSKIFSQQKYLLGASPLLFTEYKDGRNYSETIFVWGNLVEYFIDRWTQTEWGLAFFMWQLILISIFGTYQLLIKPRWFAWRMLTTHGFNWKLGHHLKGHTIKNPLII
eukprot:GHVR01103207.1.p1 GENE.GHVR01103207.1~~GHVR01103207.1.p1  ORF type:complete len:139 (+),score=22.93 GHVR01103207.1:40-456(+)